MTAAAGTIRAWVYRRDQCDRLAFSMGLLRVVLHDPRRESPAYQALNPIELRVANQVLLSPPPFVVHAVQNVGTECAQFINMPSRGYDPGHPDKPRLRCNRETVAAQPFAIRWSLWGWAARYEAVIRLQTDSASVLEFLLNEAQLGKRRTLLEEVGFGIGKLRLRPI